MSRAVRRRQKRRSDAVNRAIDEAIEKLYVATGLNTNGKRGGRLKKRGRERDADVLVAIGIRRLVTCEVEHRQPRRRWSRRWRSDIGRSR